jgi:hypothetical protein
MNKEEMKKVMYELLKENLAIMITEEETGVKIELLFDGEFVDQDFIDLEVLKKVMINNK